MKKPIDHIVPLLNRAFLFIILFAVTLLCACGDDDPEIDPDAPVIEAAEGLTARAGETVTLTFSVTAPGTVSEISVEASAGIVNITNEQEIIGSTSGTVQVSYATTGDISGKQTVTLTVRDQQGKSLSQPADIEVFVPISYGMALAAGAGDVSTTFLQGLVDLNITSVNNTTSTEIAQFAAIYSDGNSLFAAGFGAPATMGKYVFNSAGEAVLDEQIIVEGSNSFSTVEILDEDNGYATVSGGLSRAIRFSPSEMRITGEIDLSDAGEGLFYSDIIVRGNTLFIALNDFGSSGEAKVAVVDRTTNTLEKVISDARTATLSGTLTTSIMVSDANGDIYIQGSGLFSEKTSGILRIKAGETEFDPDYFFDLGTATGGSCFGLYHFGEGLTFTTLSENDDNWFGTDGNNPAFRYRKIDLSARTDGGDLDPSLPNTFATSRTMFFIQVSDDEILFPIAGTSEDALYSYTVSSGNITKKITSTGGHVTGLVTVN